MQVYVVGLSHRWLNISILPPAVFCHAVEPERDTESSTPERVALQRVADGKAVIAYNATAHLLRNRWAMPGGPRGWAQAWEDDDTGQPGDTRLLQMPSSGRSRVFILDTSGTGTATKYAALGMHVFTNEAALLQTLTRLLEPSPI